MTVPDSTISSISSDIINLKELNSATSDEIKKTKSVINRQEKEIEDLHKRHTENTLIFKNIAELKNIARS